MSDRSFLNVAASGLAGLLIGRILIVLLGGLIVLAAKMGVAVAVMVVCAFGGLGLLALFYISLFNRSASARVALWSPLGFWPAFAASAIWTAIAFAPVARDMIDRTAAP